MGTVTDYAGQRPAVKKLSFVGAIRYELIKWSTLGQSWLVFLVSMMILVLGGVGILALHAHYRGRMRPPPDAISSFTGEFGFAGAYLVACILGSLAYTSERATGAINSTLTIVPRRGFVLGAKAVIVGVAGFMIGLSGTIAGLLIAAPFAGQLGLGWPLANGSTWIEALIASSVIACFAILGLIAGVLLRSGVLTVAVIFLVLVLLPQGIALAASVGGEGMATAMAQLGGVLPSNLSGEVVNTQVPSSLRLSKAAQLAVWPVFLGWSAYARLRKRG